MHYVFLAILIGSLLVGMIALVALPGFWVATVSLGIALITLVCLFYSRAMVKPDDVTEMRDSTHTETPKDQKDWRDSPERDNPSAVDNPPTS